jgi:hypothetical protein
MNVDFQPLTFSVVRILTTLFCAECNNNETTEVEHCLGCPVKKAIESIIQL